MFNFAGKLLAFVLFVQICTSQQNEQSSLLRCLTGYKHRYEDYFLLL
jgi:sialic acid synthase SpsE